MHGILLALLLLPSFIGLWNPRVGHGAVYAVTDRQGEVEGLDVAVLGQQGTDWWVEVAYHGLDERRVRQLVSSSGAVLAVVVEEGGARRELPAGAWQGGGLPIPVTQVGQKVGQEKVGAFACDVYAVEGGSRLWICPEVTPFGLVRLQSRDLKLELVRCTGP